MRTVDYSTIFVVYNFIIGVLLMLSSEKIGSYAGRLIGWRGPQAARLTRVAALTCIAVLSGGIYIVFHVFNLTV